MAQISTTLAAGEERKPDFSGAEYNAMAKTTTLKTVRLMGFAFKNEPDFIVNHDECALGHGRKVLQCEALDDDDDSAVFGVIHFQVSAKHKRKTMMKCEAQFFVSYDTDPATTHDSRIGYFRNIAPFAAYPYFRALVAQMAWNAGVDLTPLPAIASTAHVPKGKKVLAAE